MLNIKHAFDAAGEGSRCYLDYYNLYHILPHCKRAHLKRRFLSHQMSLNSCADFLLQNDSSSQDFYSRTVAALDKKDTSDKDVAQKLKAVKDAAKAQDPDGRASPQKPIVAVADNTNSVDVPLPSEIGGTSNGAAAATGDGGRSVAGRKTIKGGEAKDVHSGKEAPKYPDTSKDKEDEGKKVETEEDHQIEIELNSILKKSPSMILCSKIRLQARLISCLQIVIIFSKSYCPYSAKAKRILLEKYTIVPTPYVVELDTHPLGPGLQAALEKSTGRRTVPNILIVGRSIGGGDEIEALDESGGLIEKVKDMAQKRIVEAKLS